MTKSVPAWLAVLLIPSPLVSQSVTVTPAIGAYIPLVQQRRAVIPDICDDPCFQPDATGARLQAAVAFGVTLAARWSGPVGFELSIATSSTQRRLANPTERAPARTTVGGMGITFNQAINPVTEVSFGAGLAITSLTGPGYDVAPLSNRWRMGPRFSARLATALNPLTRFEVALANALYRVTFTDGMGRSATQSDLVMSAGVALRVGK